MGDDEDWDPIRVKALKRRQSKRKSDRKRRKTQSRQERHARTKNQARDTDEAKRARASQQERNARQRKRRNVRRVGAENKVGLIYQGFFLEVLRFINASYCMVISIKFPKIAKLKSNFLPEKKRQVIKLEHLQKITFKVLIVCKTSIKL